MMKIFILFALLFSSAVFAAAPNRITSCGATNIYSPEGPLGITVYIVKDITGVLSAEISLINQYEGVLALTTKNLMSDWFGQYEVLKSTENIFEPANGTGKDKIFEGSRFSLIRGEGSNSEINIAGIYQTALVAKLNCW